MLLGLIVIWEDSLSK